MAKALSGVKVLEHCQMVAGPYCTKLFSDLGATVIKVEPPEGDEARRRGPFLNDIPHPERSGLFLYLNTNKFGITLNFDTAKGKSIFKGLAKQVDIIVEDKSPKEAKELGLDYELLKEVNPELIVTSITPFGQTGSYKDYKAYPLNTFHGGGEGYLMPGGIEYLDRPPVKVGGFVGEYDAGINAAIGTLGALYWRELSGQGQQVDISKQESIMSLCRADMPRYINEGLEVSRAIQGYPVGGVIPCQDGYIALITWYFREWQNFVKFMGDPDWAKEERFKDMENLRKNGEEANAYILEFLMNHTKEELYHKGQAQGVAIGTVYNAEEILNSEHLKAREFFVEIEHPEAGKIKYPSAPYKFSKTPWRVERPAPLLGQHNEEIYSQLGYSKQDLVRLRGDRII